jgi:hypothetical protein
MGLSEHPGEKVSSASEEPGKIKNQKALTIFGTVIWFLPRWHHCQAKLISSESLKTSVTRMKQALQPRVRSEAAF